MDEETFLSKPHHLLREVLRNYDSFKAVCVQSGEFCLEYRLGGTDVVVSLSAIEGARNCVLTGEGPVEIPREHRQAVLLAVMKDMTQKDAAAVIGGIKPSLISQRVEVVCEDLARHYFPEWYEVVS